MTLNLSHTLPRSSVNGPGLRFVVWTQGCPLACHGCWNPDTWPFAPRIVRPVESLIEEILGTDGIEGVTFSGGEPFAQARPLAEVAAACREAGRSVVVFTGYERSELTSVAAEALLRQTDVLVAGRYVESERSLDLPWRGSANQTVHFLTTRYAAESVRQSPSIELHVTPLGEVVATGFPPVDWSNLGDASTTLSASPATPAPRIVRPSTQVGPRRPL